ncbi:MAG TPA: hypothetical protein VMZ30_08125 [Pyrinomonadaceae bacterium]|nr:hypothetical protein [Pyrinomonadaceae bacterium]
MSELDEAWAVGIAEAEARARASGRADIAEYLALRSSNDLIRNISNDWLLNLFAAAAGAANRAGAAIQISREDSYRFKIGNATMLGTRISLHRGVRVLVIEVGWPRTPRDGFIRGGGLACANIKHVGIKAANEELRLAVDDAGTPKWIITEPATGKHQPPRGTRDLHEANVRQHLSLLLDDSRPPIST